MPAELEQTVGLARDTTLLDGYAPLPRTYDELFRGNGSSREEVADLVAELDQLEFMTRQRLAESALFRGGVTFSVYSDSKGQEKIFPFDLIPRVIPAKDWESTERGLIQRVTALNMFLSDLYDGQRIIKEGRIPESMVFGTAGYLKELHGIRPREGVFPKVFREDSALGVPGLIGGYGMPFSPRASRAEIDEFAAKIQESPEGYIAQPVVELSTCPTWVEGEAAPRRVDLRPFVLTGKKSWVLPGGLTRVALKPGSYVVNSSQGGGSKDTCVLGEPAS